MDLPDLLLNFLIFVSVPLQWEEINNKAEAENKEDIACCHEADDAKSLKFILRKHISSSDPGADVEREVVNP